MTSLAMRHKAKMMAKANSASRVRSNSSTADATVRHREALGSIAAAAQRSRPATEYETRRAELGEDLRSLKEIQSIEAKIARKADLLPKYDDWCAGVLEAAAAAAAEDKRIGTDDILVQTMVWAIDCADATRAVPRATAVIAHGMELPTRFERTAGCMIAEEFAETAMKALKLDEAIVPPLAPLLTIEAITESEDMPDQVRAKLHRAIGEVILRAADVAPDGDPQSGGGPAGGKRAAITAAIEKFKRALQLDSKAGVKKFIEIRERQLRDLEAET
jgi:hypothetical protein